MRATIGAGAPAGQDAAACGELETLRHMPVPIDLVLADGIKTFRRSFRPFLDDVESGAHGFHALTPPLADGFEWAVRR
jgi:hypothetical protein